MKTCLICQSPLQKDATICAACGHRQEEKPEKHETKTVFQKIKIFVGCAAIGTSCVLARAPEITPYENTKAEVTELKARRTAGLKGEVKQENWNYR